MKQDVKNKLIFVAGSIFGLVVLGALVQVVSAEYEWAPPGGEFPSANTAPPIDISATGQTKSGTISINVESGPGIILSNNSYVGANAQSYIVFGTGSEQSITKVYGGGLALPYGNTNTEGREVPALEGALLYNADARKVQFHNGTAWTDVGTGSGDSYWKYLSAGGIYYSDNSGPGMKTRVVIADSDVESVFAFEKVGTEYTQPVNMQHMSCDTSPATVDCNQQTYPSSGAMGEKRYDQWQSETCLEFGNNSPPGSFGCVNWGTVDGFDIWELRSSISVASNNSELTVGKAFMSDIDLSNPKWTSGYNEVPMTGSNKLGMDNYVESWVMCPDGYFMTGFRFGRDGDADLNAVIRCGKL
jgi:hypothetical protein